MALQSSSLPNLEERILVLTYILKRRVQPAELSVRLNQGKLPDETDVEYIRVGVRQGTPIPADYEIPEPFKITLSLMVDGGVLKEVKYKGQLYLELTSTGKKKAEKKYNQFRDPTGLIPRLKIERAMTYIFG